MTRAVRRMQEDADLRYFLRTFFSQAGLLAPIPTGDSLATAHFAGRHQLGYEVYDVLNGVDPSFFPELLAEEMAEVEETSASYEQTKQEPTDE